MDDENLLDIGNLKGTETYKEIGISEDLTVIEAEETGD